MGYRSKSEQKVRTHARHSIQVLQYNIQYNYYHCYTKQRFHIEISSFSYLMYACFL